MHRKQLPKSKQSKPKHKKEEAALNITDIYGQLNEWAHQGTEESIKKIEDFMARVENKELAGYAECALDEARMFYYSPQNPQEEKDLILAKVIHRRQQRFFKRMGKLDAAKLELKELDLDRQAHQRVIRDLKDENKKKGWHYNFSEDFYTMIKHRAAELEEELAYEAAWLNQAQKMIKTKKYKNIAVNSNILNPVHLDGEGETFWEDEMDNDKDENSYFDSDSDGTDYLPELDDSMDDDIVPF